MAAAGSVSRAATSRRFRGITLSVVLAVALMAGVVLSAMAGQLAISPTEVIGSVLRAIGIDTAWAPTDPIVESTLWVVRFPRLMMGLVVGAALAVAGAVMQAIFGNPLAEPGVVGVSSGAALGAAAAIVLGLTAFGSWTTAALAFMGALLAVLLAVLLVYFVSRSSGRTEVVTLLLTGIAINAFAGAGLALLMFAGDTSSREQIVFWQLGSLNGSRWQEVAIVAVITVIGTAAALLFARRYDLLSLGERAAHHLGVNVEALRIWSILLVALLTGVAVAFCGIIAFVGLVVPHIIRMAIGPAHRPLILASAIGGGALMIFADLIARTMISGADLPIGMLTSLIGGPFFFYLLYRARRQSGGWA